MTKIRHLCVALAIIPAGLSMASCAQAEPVANEEQASQSEQMVPMTRPEPTPTFTPEPAPPAEPRGTISDWSELATAPTTEEIGRYAMSPPVEQDGTKIIVLTAPDGFDSSAYVKMPDSTGLYLINNYTDKAEAEKRAKQLEALIQRDIPLDKQVTPASNASYAASFTPSSPGALKLVNIIVSPDPFAGNTVTLAFSYE